MSRPDPTVNTPKAPLIYGYEADNGDTCTFPLSQLRGDTRSAADPRLVKVPGAPGAVDLDGDEELEQGPLAVEVAYMLAYSAGTALQHAQSEIERITARPGKLWRVLPDGTCEWTRARRLGSPRKVTAVENLARTAWQNVSLAFTAPSGYWHSENVQSGRPVYYGVPLYGTVLYGGSLPDITLSGTTITGTIINTGDAICRALTMRLTAGAGGTIAAPTITNAGLYQSLSYSGTITDEDYLDLDTAAPTLEQGTASTDVWSGLSLGAAHRQGLLWLEPGANEITISSGVTLSGTATFSFYAPSH